jgi:hypothetical protein
MKNLSVKTLSVFTFAFLLSIFSATASFAQQPSVAPDAQPQANASPSFVRVGVALPKAQFSEGVDNAMMAAGVRDLVGQYLKGSNIEIVQLDARLASALGEEAKEKDCDYILQMAVTQKKSSSGFGMFKKVAPVLGSVTPIAGVSGNVAGQIAGSVAQTAIYTAANMSSATKSKDQFTLEYSLTSVETGAAKVSNSLKAKAQSDGEDVLSPMIEKVAESILTATASK